MRKLASFVLLFIWLFNVVGGLGYYLLQLHYQRSSMHRLLASTPIEQLTHISMTQAEFIEALHEEHELLIGNEMFDVAFTETKGESIHIYGLFDNHESKLLTSLREQSKQHTENDSATMATTQFVALNYLAISFKLNEPDWIETKFNPDFRHISYKDAQTSVTTPPPRLA